MDSSIGGREVDQKDLRDVVNLLSIVIEKLQKHLNPAEEELWLPVIPRKPKHAPYQVSRFDYQEMCKAFPGVNVLHEVWEAARAAERRAKAGRPVNIWGSANSYLYRWLEEAQKRCRVDRAGMDFYDRAAIANSEAGND